MAEKKQYTFEDWKTGKIYKALKDRSIEGFDYSEVKDIGAFPSDLFEQGFMQNEEFRKIENAQKETFYKGVNQIVKYNLNAIKSQIDNAPYPKEFLETTIQSLSQQIDTYPEKYRKRAYAGHWSKLMISYDKHMALNDERLINNPNFMMEFRNSAPVTNKVEQEDTLRFKSEVPTLDNHLMYVRAGIDMLKSLQNMIEDYYTKEEERENLSKMKILKRAYDFKNEKGLSVKESVAEIRVWLIDVLEFSEEEIKEKFSISISDTDSFNRLVNKHAPYKDN